MKGVAVPAGFFRGSRRGVATATNFSLAGTLV